MPILYDHHLHSRHSGDSDAPMEAQVMAGLEKGMKGLCFTEHLDMDWPYENTPDLAPGTFDLDMEAYRSEFLSLREAFRDRISLSFGVELGLQPHLGEALSAFVRANPDLDFVLGSTHLSRRMDPYYPCFFEGLDKREALRIYFRDSLKGLRAFHDIDSYAHLDYVSRYGPDRDADYRYEDYREEIDAILSFLLSNGIALEVNTAALGKGCRDMNPCRGALKRYYEMGGRRITIGSDAHAPGALAGGFEEACRSLVSIGFTGYLTFSGRRETFRSF